MAAMPNVGVSSSDPRICSPRPNCRWLWNRSKYWRTRALFWAVDMGPVLPFGSHRLRLRAAMRNPACLRRLADAPAVHARREGKIAGVVDRLRGLLTVGG